MSPVRSSHSHNLCHFTQALPRYDLETIIEPLSNILVLFGSLSRITTSTLRSAQGAVIVPRIRS